MSLHLIATNGEEGNELGGTFGSRAMMGLLPIEDPEFLRKAQKYGFSRQNLKEAILDTGRAKGYLELHIEQRPSPCQASGRNRNRHRNRGTSKIPGRGTR